MKGEEGTKQIVTQSLTVLLVTRTKLYKDNNHDCSQSAIRVTKRVKE